MPYLRKNAWIIRTSELDSTEGKPRLVRKAKVRVSISEHVCVAFGSEDHEACQLDAGLHIRHHITASGLESRFKPVVGEPNIHSPPQREMAPYQYAIGRTVHVPLWPMRPLDRFGSTRRTTTTFRSAVMSIDIVFRRPIGKTAARRNAIGFTESHRAPSSALQFSSAIGSNH